MSLPSTLASSGTVTFLFTDIEGSTNLWENHPTLMRTTLARHDALMREAIGAHKGSVFKTIGDAFCATFPDAGDALLAATAAQRAMATEDWPPETPIRVRMAVHCGPAESRDDDFFGPTVNRVARLLAAAHGGQTVLSQPVYDRAAGSAGSGVRFLDLGVHRLKDLVQAEHVYQVVHPSLRADFPPLRSLESSVLPNNLPLQLTSFVGRKSELETVAKMVDGSRIVTLTGSGGCGKTRLALQVAADISDTFPDGVWFVDLAPVSDPKLVAESVAGLLGVREEPGHPLERTLAAYLARKSALIVLDTCEHLLLACARLAEALVRSCPGVRMLATSREPLNIAGESSYRVPSLALPDARGPVDPASLQKFESVALFVDRARAVSADFTVSPDNARALAGICRHLDGIPLAIELAAARVRSLTPDQIAGRLDDRFRLLTGGTRTAMPRQQTLRALVDWSYDLLTEPERALLRRLSVFAGGWTLEAAESVAEGDQVEDWEVLDLTTSLVDKSLVSFEPTAGDRYRLLETVRRYGQEKLAEVGEAEATAERHLAWYAGLAEEAGAWQRGPQQAQWLDRLEREQDNLAKAFETALARPGDPRSAPLSWTLGLLHQHRGFLNEAVRNLDAGLQAAAQGVEGTGVTRARLLYERAGLHQDFGESDDAQALAAEALAAFIDHGDDIGAAKAENLIGQVAMSRRRFDEARSLFEASLARFEAADDRIGASIVHNNLGVLARRGRPQDDEGSRTGLATARAHLEKALAVRKQTGDALGEAETLNNLGVVAYELEDYAGAWTHYRAALAIERALRRTTGMGTTLANMGEVAGVLGDMPLALRLTALSERVLDDVQSPLAGAVRSMFLELAEQEPQAVVEAARASVTERTLDDGLDEAVAADPNPNLDGPVLK
ncbi:MAG: tetratricopeptide repeat protein [Armatimonadetes bacterium]|nr:tetratricopeptide repeat protein [Armatimonadota bacterium]